MSDSPGFNADGTVDYSGYTEEQLFRALRRIDAERYPLNFVKLKAAFAARRIPIDDSLNATDALMAAQNAVYLRPQQRLAPENQIAFAPRPGLSTLLGPSRNDFRFVGFGSIEIQDGIVSVKGRRFGFILGLPIMRRVEIPLTEICNVEVAENVVRFERRAPEGGASKSLTFWVEDEAAAEKLVQRLPPEKTPDFVPQLAAYLDFEEQLENRSRQLPVTYGFALLCLLMFAVTILNGAEWFNSRGLIQIRLGSNLGSATLGGEWWRLFTHSLLHFGLIHLVFNLWALVSFGTIAERLYGSLRYAIICVVAGVAGGMASISLQPNINSAGASATIFGILGALLVSQFRGADAIPPSVRRSLQKSTLFFAVVTLSGGLLFKGIDNAAHVGGLIAGICMGLAFQSPRRAVRIVAPAAMSVLIILSGVVLARRAAEVEPADASYWESASWFVAGESVVVANWTDVQALAAAKAIGEDAMADRLEASVVPFWREANERFARLEFPADSDLFDAHQYLKKVSAGRLHAIELCISGLRKHDAEIVGACMKEMEQVDALIHARQKVVEESQ